MDKRQRENFFIDLEEELLIGGAAFSEWSVFISKSAYDAFINGADLAAIITTLAVIESYLRTEDPNSKGKNLFILINEYDFIDEKTRFQIHQLRKYSTLASTTVNPLISPVFLPVSKVYQIRAFIKFFSSIPFC